MKHTVRAEVKILFNSMDSWMNNFTVAVFFLVPVQEEDWPYVGLVECSSVVADSNQLNTPHITIHWGSH